jgi:5,10-methylenetetrahydromethanopterin reductase
LPNIGIVVSGNAIVSTSDVFEIALKCETSKVIQSFWMGEVRNFDAGVTLATVATMSKRIRLGTSILNVYSRSPAQLAMLVRTMQEVSGGRFTLGIGVSTPALIEGFHGFEFDAPMQRMGEYIEKLRELLEGEKPRGESLILKKTNAKLVGNLPPPAKILVAALNRKMTRLAGEKADGVIFNFLTPSSAKQKISWFNEGIETSKRKLIETEVCTQLYIDAEYKEDHLKRLLYFYSSSEAYRKHFASLGFEREASEMARAWHDSDRDRVMRAITPELIAGLSVAGDKSKLIHQIDELGESGIDTVILAPNVYSDVKQTAKWAIETLQESH